MLRPTKPSARSTRMTTCLAWLGGLGLDRLALVVRAGVDDHVGRLRARALDLQVAAHARPELLLRDAHAVLARRRERLARDLATLHVDEVLVVRAGDLVLVARRRVAAGVLLQQRRVALRVVHRRRARRGLRVGARHDHDAVVVARRVDGRLDGLELALLAQPLVDPDHALRGLLGVLDDGLARAQPEPAPAGAADRLLGQAQRGPLADHADLARAGAGHGRDAASWPSAPRRPPAASPRCRAPGRASRRDVRGVPPPRSAPPGQGRT